MGMQFTTESMDLKLIHMSLLKTKNKRNIFERVNYINYSSDFS